jgi:hypothetical protein
MRQAWVTCSLVAGLVSTAHAQAPGEPEPGYCEMVRGVAAAEAALLQAPEAFASGGVVNPGEVAGTGTSVPLGRPRARLTAGLNYDVVGLLRGVALQQQAEAECERYRALQALQAAVKQGTSIGAETALQARERVLRQELVEAERLLAAARGEVEAGRSTLEELNVVQLRVDGLRALAHQTRQELERLRALPRLEEHPLPALLAGFRSADARVEALSAELRNTLAWRVRLQAGYDELIGVPQSLPLFGLVTVSYNLGNLWQPAANARAGEGRRRALEEDVEGIAQEVTRLVGELRAAWHAEQARLREVGVLVADLEHQLHELESLETQKVRHYRGYLRLELARLRAEHAWLQAHVQELGRFLEAA